MRSRLWIGILVSLVLAGGMAAPTLAADMGIVTGGETNI